MTIGRYSTGSESHPAWPANRRVGSFADGHVRPLTQSIEHALRPAAERLAA